MSNIYGLFKNAVNDIRYFVTFGSILVLSLLLLFMDKLPDMMKEHFVPSLVVFIIGAAFLASLQAMVGARIQQKQQTLGTGPLLIPVWGFWLFMGLNGLWFAAFIGFNIYNGSL